MAELLAEVGPNLALFKVNVDECREQDVNARVMPPEMFERLTETVRKEKRLESLPLTVRRDGFFEMVSGHHRLRAARAAGMTEIFVLAELRDLDRSAVVAKQLAHNRISGEDDKQTLKKLYAELKRVDDVLETFLRPEDFDDVRQLDPVSVPDVAAVIPWKTLTFVFLPPTLDKIDDFEAVVRKIPKETDQIGIVSTEVFDRFREAVLAVGRTENVRALGAVLTRMTEIVEEHLRADPTADPAQR